MYNYPDGITDRDIDRIYGETRHAYAIYFIAPDEEIEDVIYITDADSDDLEDEIERLEKQGCLIVETINEETGESSY